MYVVRGASPSRWCSGSRLSPGDRGRYLGLITYGYGVIRDRVVDDRLRRIGAL